MIKEIDQNREKLRERLAKAVYDMECMLVENFLDRLYSETNENGSATGNKIIGEEDFLQYVRQVETKYEHIGKKKGKYLTEADLILKVVEKTIIPDPVFRHKYQNVYFVPEDPEILSSFIQNDIYGLTVGVIPEQPILTAYRGFTKSYFQEYMIQVPREYVPRKVLITIESDKGKAKKAEETREEENKESWVKHFERAMEAGWL